MDSFAPLVAYAAALAIAAVIPGPGVAALVGQALGRGLRPSLFFLGGIALGDVVWLTVAIAGLAALAQVFAGALLVVKLLGGAYLVYLAWKFWTSEAGLVRADSTRGPGGMRAFLAGFMLTLGNPKTIIFYLALLPSVLDLRQVHLGEWSLLALLTVVILFLGDFLQWDQPQLSAASFIVAIGLLMGALLLFLLETRQASAALRIPEDYLEWGRSI